MNEQQTAPKLTLRQQIAKHCSYPMLLIAIYSLFQISPLLQTLRGFSLRGIVGFLAGFLYVLLPFALLALLWLDRSGKLPKKGLLKIFLGVEALLAVRAAYRSVINLLIIITQIGSDFYSLMMDGFIPNTIESVLFALLFVTLALSVLGKAPKAGLFKGMAALYIFCQLFFGILLQLIGAGSLFSALLDAIFIIALFHLPKVLEDPHSVEITAARGKNLRLIIILTLIVALLSGMAVGGGGGGGSTSSNTCGSCGRSWSAGDAGGNFMSIAKTGMCKNCKGNFDILSPFLD